MDHDAQIQAAITDLESQERVNYSATAKRWNLERTVANMPRYGLLFAGSYSYSAGQVPEGFGCCLVG